MAYLKQRADGQWRVQVEKLGVRDSIVRPTKAEARNWGAAREAEILAGVGGALPRKTVRQALERYKAEVSSKKKGKRWEEIRIDAFIERTLPWVDKILHLVDQTDVAAWRDARLQYIAGESVRREWNLLSNVFSIAIDEWKWAREHPMKKVRRPPPGQPRSFVYTPGQVRQVCRALGWRSRQPETLSQEVALAFLVAQRTAMRAGEILALRSGDIDLAKRVAWLHTSKNGEARGVPFPSSAIWLMAMIKAKPLQVSESSRDALFRKARQKVGIAATFHDSRASGATRLAKKLNPFALTKVLGQKDPKVTFDHYYRDSPEEIAEQLDRRTP